jgi:hypothetical protein
MWVGRGHASRGGLRSASRPSSAAVSSTAPSDPGTPTAAGVAPTPSALVAAAHALATGTTSPPAVTRSVSDGPEALTAAATAASTASPGGAAPDRRGVTTRAAEGAGKRLLELLRMWLDLAPEDFLPDTVRSMAAEVIATASAHETTAALGRRLDEMVRAPRVLSLHCTAYP